MKFSSVVLPLLALLFNQAIGADIASPENQVFQFMQSGTCSSWSDGSTNKASAYLWIPENCQRLRGLLILCTNVPEHRLVGHPAIREVCAANNLGIVWCVPSFMNFRKDKVTGADMARENKTTLAFLQQLLDGLAQTSGYEDVATVPWLPMGESGHLLMVDALVEEMPQRCIAGMWLKNNHLPPKNRETPAFVVYGTLQEWGQDKTDIRTKWNDVQKSYEGVANQQKQHPAWPLTYLIDGTSGHFDCSEKLTNCIARYIGLVSKARLSDDGSPTLKPLQLDSGFVADLPVPGHENQPVISASGAPAGLPWFFDRASAEEAQAIAKINWQAETQLPGFKDAAGNVLPFDFNGIPRLTPETDADGVFTLHSVMLDTLPANFVGAGEKLAKAPGEPTIEWLCGPVIPLGNDQFRIALDRTWPSGACYLAARQSGTATIRDIVEPCGIQIKKNTEGTPQRITFEPIPEVTNGTKSIRVRAQSDSGLPVKFFVRSGPAEIHGDELVFTPVPPRSKRPIAITVVAWQWGRSTAPAIQTAELVEQTILLK